MFKKLLGIVKNRAKVSGTNFVLELIIGILQEWQRANSAGALDLHQKKKNETFNNSSEDEIKH